MIKFNRYSSKFEFNFSTDLKQYHYSAYGPPIRLLKRKSDGKLFKVVYNSKSSLPNAKLRFLLAYRREVVEADCWNLVFFKTPDDMIKFDHMIPDVMEVQEVMDLRNKNEVELIDPVNLILIYEPK